MCPTHSPSCDRFILRAGCEAGDRDIDLYIEYILALSFTAQASTTCGQGPKYSAEFPLGTCREEEEANVR